MFSYILQNKLVAAALTILILGGVWYGLTSSAAPGPILQTESAASPDEQEIVATLLTLRSVTLSGTIFSDNVFKSLKDFGVSINPEPIGRDNPFAPLTIITPPTVQASKAANIFAPTKK